MPKKAIASISRKKPSTSSRTMSKPSRSKTGTLSQAPTAELPSQTSIGDGLTTLTIRVLNGSTY